MLKKIEPKKESDWKKFFAIIILLLFLGAVLAIALGNFNFIDIFWKIP